MDASWLGLAEPLLVFGGLIAFMIWQFRELRQRAEARAREALEQPDQGVDRASDDPPGHPER